MGHIRLGRLPRTRRWQEVVALIAGGAHAAQIANATIRAAERILSAAFHDVGLRNSLWLFLQLPLAARTTDFREALDRLGLSVSHATGLMDILGAFADAIDERLANNCGRTDLGEMAQFATTQSGWTGEQAGPRRTAATRPRRVGRPSVGPSAANDARPRRGASRTIHARKGTTLGR
jgi:hypothetical protein